MGAAKTASPEYDRPLLRNALPPPRGIGGSKRAYPTRGEHGLRFKATQRGSVAPQALVCRKIRLKIH